MSRKIYMPNRDIDPDTRTVVDLSEIAKNMTAEEAMGLIDKDGFFKFTIFASECDVPDEMLKEIFFTDSISGDLYYVCITWDTPAEFIDIKTMTDPDTNIMCLRDIMRYSNERDVFIATSKSNYVIMASDGDYQGDPAIILYVWDLRRSSIY